MREAFARSDRALPGATHLRGGLGLERHEAAGEIALGVLACRDGVGGDRADAAVGAGGRVRPVADPEAAVVVAIGRAAEPLELADQRGGVAGRALEALAQQVDPAARLIDPGLRGVAEQARGGVGELTGVERRPRQGGVAALDRLELLLQRLGDPVRLVDLPAQARGEQAGERAEGRVALELLLQRPGHLVAVGAGALDQGGQDGRLHLVGIAVLAGEVELRAQLARDAAERREIRPARGGGVAQRPGQRGGHLLRLVLGGGHHGDQRDDRGVGRAGVARDRGEHSLDRGRALVGHARDLGQLQREGLEHPGRVLEAARLRGGLEAVHVAGGRDGAALDLEQAGAVDLRSAPPLLEGTALALDGAGEPLRRQGGDVEGARGRERVEGVLHERGGARPGRGRGGRDGGADGRVGPAGRTGHGLVGRAQALVGGDQHRHGAGLCRQRGRVLGARLDLPQRRVGRVNGGLQLVVALARGRVLASGRRREALDRAFGLIGGRAYAAGVAAEADLDVIGHGRARMRSG